MSRTFHRREFFARTGSAAIAAGAKAAERIIRVGVVGVGNRGTGLLRSLVRMPALELPAICDINEEHLARAQGMVEKSGRPRPEGYSRGLEDFRRLAERGDLDAVILATPRDWHTRMAVAAMKAGKYAGVEVPAPVNLEQCWELVDTSEQTGVPCMMLENVCHFRNVMTVLNLIRQGLLGELLHGEVGYQHYNRPALVAQKKSGMASPRTAAPEQDGKPYPTHGVGPAAWWMDINRGDRFTYLTSMSCNSLGHISAAHAFGPDHPRARRISAQGGVNTSLSKTEKGRTLTVYYNTCSPRPYDLILRVQGTDGTYSGTLDEDLHRGSEPDAARRP